MQLYFFYLYGTTLKLGCKMLRFRSESLDGIDLQETGRFSEKVQK